MKLFRSLLGRRDDSEPDAPAARKPAQWPVEDEAARELQLAREFDAGLSDLARQQLQFAAYAPPEPPSQVDRRGTWVTTDDIEVADDDGVVVTIHSETLLEFIALDEAASVLRFRTNRGQEVTVTGDAGPGWPEQLERPSGSREV
jgi:hypothetical protein